MVYLPSDRRLPTTDEPSPPSAAGYAQALLAPIVDSWRRQYAAISARTVRRAQPQLDYAASADFLTASAVRLAGRIEDLRQCMNATLRPCLDTPPPHDAVDGIRAAVLNLRESFDALLDWEHEIRSVQVHRSLARIQGPSLGASAYVIDTALRTVDRWIDEVKSGSASTRTPAEALDGPPALTAALTDLRDSMRARATINVVAWSIVAFTTLYVVLTW